MISCLSRLSTPLACVHIVCAFTFVPGELSQCDNLTVTWIGERYEWSAKVIQVYGTPQNVIIPPSSFSNGQGSFSTQLQFPQGQQMILTMSDGSGFGSGGSTALLQIGAPHGSINCNTISPGVAFFFQLNSALQQCRPYIFSAYSGAIQPVTIKGIIPNGTSFVLTPPVGPTTFAWTNNITVGSTVIFMMVDAQERAGGSSEVLTVAGPDDTSCLNNLPLPPTRGLGSTSPVVTSSVASTAAIPRIPIAAIIGSALGVLLFVLLSLGLFYLKWRRGWDFRTSFGRKSGAPTITPYDIYHTPSTHLSARRSTTRSSILKNRHDTNSPLNTVSPNPFDRIPTYSLRSSHQHESPQRHPSLDHNPSSQSPLSHIVVHMDVEGHLHSTLREVETVESPPQYSAIYGIPGAVGSPWHDREASYDSSPNSVGPADAVSVR
ncbi:hypothetical protein BD779DRAFT_1441748 [Infundibulicybe gibba]|nr:hypothetical protein BD779DRAFT_1441748 [Infundibulicybe gibba]